MINKFIFSCVGAMVCATQSVASVQMSESDYRFGVLNRSIDVPKDLMTFKEILQLIEERTGYNVVNKVEEIPFNKKYVELSKYKIVGDLLNATLTGYDAIVDVDKTHYIIKITYPESIYINLPYGWNMEHLKKQFKQLSPYVDFTIQGNRLTAFGVPKDIAKLANYFKVYQDNAFKKDSFRVALYPYCTKIKKNVFVGRRKFYGSEEYKPMSQSTTSLGQGEKVAISYRKTLNINMTYNKSKEVIEIGKYSIPINKLSAMGIVFKAQGETQKRSGIMGYILNGKKSNNLKCNDIIIVIDNNVDNTEN